MFPARMFRCTKWHCPLCDSEPQLTQQPNMVLFFFIELRGRTSHCSDPNMFYVSYSHKSCKYSSTWHYLKKIWAPNITKFFSPSMCCISQKELTTMNFQKDMLNMLNLSSKSKYSLECRDPKVFAVFMFPCSRTDPLNESVMSLVLWNAEICDVKSMYHFWIIVVLAK